MTRSEILDTAKKCVCGQREQDYGSPESNFQIIADLWNAYLGKHCCSNVDGYACLDDLTPTDVAMMMALLKIARIKNGGGTGDSFVDLAGYAACGGEISCRSMKKSSDIPNIPAEKVGHWINNQNGTYTCDICGCKHSRSNYCPDCGRKMEDMK